MEVLVNTRALAVATWSRRNLSANLVQGHVLDDQALRRAMKA